MFENKKKSFFTTYGPLSFPVIVLTIFGWFHLPIGPSSKSLGKCLGKFTKIYMTLTLIITELVCVNFIYARVSSVSMSGKQLLYLSGAGFFIFLIILLPVIINLSRSKTYSYSTIIMDINKISQKRISCYNTTNVIICYMIALGCFLPLWYFNYTQMKTALSTGTYPYTLGLFGTFNVSNIIENQALADILFDSLFFNSINVAFLFNSLVIAIICLLISNEFEASSQEFSQVLKMKPGEAVSHFYRIKNRFQNIVELVTKVNNHFTCYIGLTIIISLFTICSMTYVITLMIRDADRELQNEGIFSMSLPVIRMTATVLLLTIPASHIHTKVSDFVQATVCSFAYLPFWTYKLYTPQKKLLACST